MFSEPIRAVSPRINPRCPSCHCFVRLDFGTCSSCGFAFALASESRQYKSQHFSNLQPNGKIIKPKQPKGDFAQLDMFRILGVC